MDSLFEILFVALILLAPLLESLLKKGKKKQQGGGDAEAERGTASPQRSSGATTAGRTATAERGQRQRTRASGTSEGLIPAEIWEELTGMRTPQTVEEEAAPGEVAGETETTWWEEGRDREAAEIAGEAVGTGEIGGAGGVRSGEIRPGQPDRRRTGAVERRQPAEVTAEEAELAARFEKAQARAAAAAASAVTGTALLGASAGGSGRARRLVAGASRRRLQDAILLTEILGPPLAMRPDGSGGAS